MRSKFKTILLIIVITSFLAAFCAAAGSPSKAKNQAADAQLEINTTALLSADSAEKIRVNAAVLLLLSEHSQARKTLLSALANSNNTTVQIAVCKALKQSRGWDETIYNREDFFAPLVNLLGDDNPQLGKLAAEALLIYDYEYLGNRLKKIINDDKLPLKKRLDALNALKGRPDKNAILDMIGLIDNKDKAIATAAERDLEKLLGVPVGADKNEWKRIANELRKKSKDEFVADRLVVQYEKVRSLEEQLNSWKTKYIEALGKLYDGMADDNVRAQFLVEQLTNGDSGVILWAISRADEWKSSGKALPDSVAASIIALTGNGNAQVRMEVAKLLAGMGNFGPSSQLLPQIKKEKNQAVRLEQFKALGECVYYALSPGASVKVANEIRLEALNLGDEYLSRGNGEYAKAGADVIRKLLEQDGLDVEVVKGHLAKLSERFAKVGIKNVALKVYLLDVMAKLCGERSAFKAQASEIYRGIFTAAVDDKALREASIDGLKNINEVDAMAIFREKKFYDDENANVRKAVIELAGKVGVAEDINWLVGKVNKNGDSESSFKALNSIVDRSGAGVSVNAVELLKGANAKAEQVAAILLKAETKAYDEEQPLALNPVRLDLARYYVAKGDLGKGFDYYSQALNMTEDANVKQAINSELIDVYLQTEQFDKIGEVINGILAVRDVANTEVLVVKLTNYLGNGQVGADKKAALMAVIRVIAVEQRPVWGSMVAQWEQIGKSANSKQQELNDK